MGPSLQPFTPGSVPTAWPQPSPPSPWMQQHKQWGVRMGWGTSGLIKAHKEQAPSPLCQCGADPPCPWHVLH